MECVSCFFLNALINDICLCDSSLQSPCSSFPCKNGATCVPNYDDDTFHCICKKGFSSKLCRTGTYRRSFVFFVVCFVVVTSRSTWNLDVGPTFIERTILFYGLLVWDTSYFTILSAYLITEFFYVIWLQQNRIIFKWSWSSICAMVFDYFRAFPWIKFTFCIVSFLFLLACFFTKNYGVFLCFPFFSFIGFYYVLPFVFLSFVPLCSLSLWSYRIIFI